jgi:hypothetical protein
MVKNPAVLFNGALSQVGRGKTMTKREKELKRKKIWVQQVAVDSHVLQTRLDVARARGLGRAQLPLAAGIQGFIDAATRAADRQDPIPSRLLNWWRGVLVNTAYRNIHAAGALLVDLQSEAELEAGIPGTVARAATALGPDDPRCISQDQLRALPLPVRRARLRQLTGDGYEALDLKHEQLRSFRNIILLAAATVIALMAATILAVSAHPGVMPLCFVNEVSQSATQTVEHNFNCPTRDNTSGPSSGDIWIVVLMGLLGGTLATSVAIRRIQGTSTPYDVPVALAWLKIPLGAFTAVLGIVAIRGGFVPGLSVLDSQQQILAYALLLGFAQQAFTRLLDDKAQSLLNAVPSKDGQAAQPRPTPVTPAPAPVGRLRRLLRRRSTRQYRPT